MSFAQILEEVDRLTEEERTELAHRLRARELSQDAKRTADMSARLEANLAGSGVVTEEQLRAQISARGFARS